MNIIAGIAALKDGSVDSQTAERVRSALAVYACGPQNIVHAGRTVIGAGLTLNGLSDSPQPYRGRAGTVITLDGRMDRIGDVEVTAPDTDLGILRALESECERNPRNFCERLVGDYALVVVEGQGRRLMLARDFVGAKSLYFAVTGTLLAFASKLSVLLHLSRAGSDPDLAYMAQFLAGRVDTGRSPYRAIASVKAGHCVTVDLRTGSMEDVCHWHPERLHPIKMRDENEYEERFTAEFERSILRRMRGRRATMADLSGGIDSSSIVCIADRAAQRFAYPHVATWTRVFKGAMEDESRFVGIIENGRGRKTNWVADKPAKLFDDAALPATITAPCCFYYSPVAVKDLNVLFRTLDIEAHLCGYGGDQTLWNIESASSPALLEQLHAGRPIRFLREVFEALLTGAPISTLADSNYRTWKRGRGWKSRGLRHYAASGVLKSTFVSAYEPSTLHVDELESSQFETFGEAFQAQAIAEVRSSLHGGIYPEELLSDRRYPYLDRDLNEFLFAIPSTVKKRAGETRTLMRRGLAQVVPDQILNRRGKGLIDTTLSRDCGGLLGDEESLPLFLESLGVVAMDNWRNLLRRAAHGAENCLGIVVHILAVEAWLRRKPNYAASSHAGFGASPRKLTA
jgi:asparagine synthase (glutamine-hydrolysing)